MGLREPADGTVGSSYFRLLVVVSLPDEYCASSAIASDKESEKYERNPSGGQREKLGGVRIGWLLYI